MHSLLTSKYLLILWFVGMDVRAYTCGYFSHVHISVGMCVCLCSFKDDCQQEGKVIHSALDFMSYCHQHQVLIEMTCGNNINVTFACTTIVAADGTV